MYFNLRLDHGQVLNKRVILNSDGYKRKTLLRHILDAVLKKGVLRIFQHGLVPLGTPVLDKET